MTLKLAQLPLYLTPGEALTLIDFLDQLQTLLWDHYGDAIQHDLRESSAPLRGDNEADFDDPLPF